MRFGIYYISIRHAKFICSFLSKRNPDQIVHRLCGGLLPVGIILSSTQAMVKCWEVRDPFMLDKFLPNLHSTKY